MSDLQVPVALDERGYVVLASEGRSGARYTCPGDCGGTLCWKDAHTREEGLVRVRAHFAHLPDEGVACGESAVHNGAKLRAVRDLYDWAARVKPKPVLVSTCVEGHETRTVLPHTVTEEPRDEHELPSGRIVDVWAGFAVEIRHTHAVDTEKASDLLLDGVAWLEIEAAPLAFEGEWRLTKRGRCPECECIYVIERPWLQVEPSRKELYAFFDSRCATRLSNKQAAVLESVIGLGQGQQRTFRLLDKLTACLIPEVVFNRRTWLISPSGTSDIFGNCRATTWKGEVIRTSGFLDGWQLRANVRIVSESLLGRERVVERMRKGVPDLLVLYDCKTLLNKSTKASALIRDYLSEMSDTKVIRFFEDPK